MMSYQKKLPKKWNYKSLELIEVLRKGFKRMTMVIKTHTEKVQILRP